MGVHSFVVCIQGYECVNIKCVCVCQLCHSFPVKYRAILEIITPHDPGFDRTSSISVAMSSYDIMFSFSDFNIGAPKNRQAS